MENYGSSICFKLSYCVYFFKPYLGKQFHCLLWKDGQKKDEASFYSHTHIEGESQRAADEPY